MSITILSMENVQPVSSELTDYHHKKMWNIIHYLDQVQVLSTASFNTRPCYSCP
jgi:hypothetical protein